MTEEKEQPEEIPLKVEITNHQTSEIKDTTSWEETDPWDFTKMTEEDIKEAEESRNA